MDKIIRLVLVVLATARLVRFVTEDTLGGWWVRDPVRRWAAEHEGVDLDGNPDDFDDAVGDPRDWGWRVKAASGIDCRWCAGFWIGVLVLVGEVTLGRVPGVRHVWRFGLATLALNSVANATGKAIHTLP